MKLNKYTTVVHAIEALKKRGYRDEFKFSNGILKNLNNGKTYTPEELSIVEYHRYEGISNPSDMSIVFAVEGNDGCKGTVVSSYGMYADMTLVEFMDKVKIKSRAKDSGQA